MSTIPNFTLNTGASIPAIGIGTWPGFTEGECIQSKEWLLTALKAGYRRIDAAWLYGNEKAVGQAIKESGIPREEMFVSTKLPWHHPGREEWSLQCSLNNLGLDYVDAYLLHWPQTMAFEDNNRFPFDSEGELKVIEGQHFTKTWAQMEKLHNAGKTKSIGVSNFSIKTLTELLETAETVPADNQVEIHPYLVQEDLVQFCKQRDIRVTAYTPTGYEVVRKDPVIVELAEKYRVTPTQVILAWHLSRGVAIVPCSKRIKHQEENINLPTLDPEDVKLISGLDKNMRLAVKVKNGKVAGWPLEKLGW